MSADSPLLLRALLHKRDRLTAVDIDHAELPCERHLLFEYNSYRLLAVSYQLSALLFGGLDSALRIDLAIRERHRDELAAWVAGQQRADDDADFIAWLQ